MQKTFEENNGSSKLSKGEKQEIFDTLRKYLSISEEDSNALIDDIEKTVSFRQFGYGSLIGDPSSETDQQYGGVLPNWKKGAFCKDRAFRGKWNSLGVTMGALEDKDSTLKGVVNEISAQGEGNFADRIIKSIKDFALRETGLNPIYVYKAVDITTSRHGSVKALICAADPSNPLYLGPEKDGLGLEQKAAIIATSIGDKDKQGNFITSPRHTGMSYWRDHVYCCQLGGYEPDPDIKHLVGLAEYYREQLKKENPTLHSRLISIEQKQKPSGARPGRNYSVPVYDAAQVQPPRSPLGVRQMARQARAKAKLHTDPLSREDVQGIKSTIQELKFA